MSAKKTTKNPPRLQEWLVVECKRLVVMSGRSRPQQTRLELARRGG